MPKGRPKPSLEQAETWAHHDHELWRRRDLRFEREQAVFYLKPAWLKTPEKGEEQVVPSDPAYITEKAARNLAAMEPKFEIKPRDPSQAERSQKIENLTRENWAQWQRQWTRGLHGSLPYEMAKYVVQRGWVCSRLMLSGEGDSAEPTLHTLWDPATVYPYEVGGQLVRVTHRYRAQVSDLVEDGALPEAEDAFSEWTRPSGQAWVNSQYVKYHGVYYHMAWVEGGGSARGNGKWLKKPTQIDYMPWVISWAVGSPWRATEWDEEEYIEHVGESFFTNMMGMYKQQQRMMSMVATIIATMANPPTALMLDEGGKIEASQIKMKPGSRMVFPKGRIEQFRLGAGLSDITAYWQMLQDRQNKASFAAVTFGEQTGIESGYMGETLKAGNIDVMYPYIDCLQSHLQQLQEKGLKLVADHWPEGVEVYVQAGQARPGGYEMVTAQDILDERPQVEVSFNRVSLTERLQLANMAALLRRENIISLMAARGKDFVNLDDPWAEEMAVQSDLVKMDPAMVKALVPMALAFTGLNMEKELYGVLHGGEIAQLLQMGMAGGQPPAPPQGQPPAGPAGVDSAAMAPGPLEGSVPQVQGDLAQLLNILRMVGAQGGGGQGGVPPPGGVGFPPGSIG